MNKDIFNKIQNISEEIDRLREEKSTLMDDLKTSLLKECKFVKNDIISGFEQNFSTLKSDKKKLIVIDELELSFSSSFENGFGIIAIGHTVTKMNLNDKPFYKQNYKSSKVKIYLNDKAKFIEKY